MSCEEQFETLGLSVERFAAVDGKWVRNLRGFETAGRYAHALGTRLMLRGFPSDC